MATGTTLRRLKKEYATLDKERPPGVLIVRPLETNCLHAHFLLAGEAFYDTPYEGGVYHGVLQFPREYPMKPPAVIMRTPSGRFQPDKKICFSLSDYHPELWNPMWNIGTILTGLVSFMNSEEITTGGMSAPADARREFARKSLTHVMKQDEFAKELFANVLEKMTASRVKNGEDKWPPARPPPTKETKQFVLVAERTASATRTGRQAKVTAQRKEAESDIEPTVTNTAEVTTGKNVSKNRKKRDIEKRKKRASSFLSNLREQMPQFLQGIVNALDGMGVNVSEYPCDHVCWRTESIEEYSDLVTTLKAATDSARLLVESEIGGRSIATFELLEPVNCGDGRVVNVVEIPAPKDGRPYKRGLEHVEFVIGKVNNENGDTSIMSEIEQKAALEEFIKKNSGVDWKTKAIGKPLNPDVSLLIEVEAFGLCCAKFHLITLADVIRYEKEQGS